VSRARRPPERRRTTRVGRAASRLSDRLLKAAVYARAQRSRPSPRSGPRAHGGAARRRERRDAGSSVWTPPRQVAFGRRDAREPGFGRAKRLAAERGFEPIERDGGRAVAYPGDTLAFAHALPLVDGRGFESIPDRYERAIETVIRALRSLGAEVSTGEPPESFCPGDHSIRVAGGGKVAGIAQRVRGTPRRARGGLSGRHAGGRECRRRCHRGGVRRARRSIRPRDGRERRGGERSRGSETSRSRALEDAFVDGPWGDGEPKIDRIDRSG